MSTLFFGFATGIVLLVLAYFDKFSHSNSWTFNLLQSFGFVFILLSALVTLDIFSNKDLYRELDLQQKEIIWKLEHDTITSSLIYEATSFNKYLSEVKGKVGKHGIDTHITLIDSVNLANYITLNKK